MARLASRHRLALGDGGVMGVAWSQALQERTQSLLDRRTHANERFFATEAPRIARLCHRMAERFACGGRLVSVGASPQARSDVRHVAVEFVHPVIVGKRALPAIGIASEGGSVLSQLELLAEADDIVIAFEAERDTDTEAALALARRRGCLTIAFADVGAEWQFEPQAGDPFIDQELVETLYHLLWELVHVFFEHRGLLEGRATKGLHNTGASSFLYPFLAEQEHDLESVVSDVSASAKLKADDVGALRTQTLTDASEVLGSCAEALRSRLDAGGKVLALGNGGSATDAMDAVADLRMPPGHWPPRYALDLCEDPAILTAIANDIATEAIFSRQIIAYARDQDAVLALSTSGNSHNVIQALDEARRRGLQTIAMVGYDGGRIASEGLADHIVVTRSEHIPRIQEAQASAYHVLRELVELAGD
jgi:D-sedoheptulose 7-phosphate isomerase